MSAHSDKVAAADSRARTALKADAREAKRRTAFRLFVWNERAAIAEFDGKLTRAEAEKLATLEMARAVYP